MWPALTIGLWLGSTCPGGATGYAATQDWHARLARHWAPVIFQNVEVGAGNPLGRYDFLTSADFDGDTNAGNNWEHADDAVRTDFPLRPSVYYAVIETETHYYVTYSLFHPRDWTWSTAVQGLPLGPSALTHENDLESATLVILKDKGFGELRLVGTVCHLNNYCFVAGSGISIKTWALDLAGGDAITRYYQGRPCLFVESGGHGIGGIGRALDARSGGAYTFGGSQYAFRGDAGIVYVCADDPAYVPGTEPAIVDGAAARDTVCIYQLVSLLDSLWPLRGSSGPDSMFDAAFTYQSAPSCSPITLPVYLAAEGQDRGANPPWARVASSDGLQRGAWFLDPARAFDHYVKSWNDPGLPGYARYARNDYAMAQVEIRLTAPADDRTWVEGYPGRIRWQVVSGAQDLAGQAALFISRNSGKAWTGPAVTVDVASGECAWTITGPAAEQCLIALRAPLSCNPEIAVVGLAQGPSIAAAHPMQWLCLSENAPEPPDPRTFAQAVYDDADDRLVVFGGEAGEAPGQLPGDLRAFDFADFTWDCLDAGIAQAPAGRKHHVLTYDPAGRRLLLYGGSQEDLQILGDVWLFALGQGTWEQVAALEGDCRAGAVGIYDPAGERLVVFGGWDSQRARNDVRALGLNDAARAADPRWETLHAGAGIAPAARAYAAGAYDPSARRLIVYGGLGGAACDSALADTWAFSLDTGAWEMLHAGGGECPPARWLHTALLDGAGYRLVTYGGDPAAARGETWAFDLEDRQWTLLNSGQGDASPDARAGATAALRSPGRQLVVLSYGGLWSMGLGGGPPGNGNKVRTRDDTPILGPAVSPNPFRGEATISFSLDRPGRVRIAFYDVAGRLVRMFRDSEMPAGTHSLTWNGRDTDGTDVAAGVYYCSITAGGVTHTRPAVIVR
jgi:hypothetical protein